MKRIPAWSFSRWRKWDACPRSAKHAYIDKLPDPPGPAMQRGSDIHEACEVYLKAPMHDAVPCPEEALSFRREMEELHAAPGLHVEESWAFTKDWKECDWFDRRAWFRAKVDARHGAKADGVMTIIDFKTGSANRQPGPEAEKQAECYALAAFKKFNGHLHKVIVEFWYFDRPLEDNRRQWVYTREHDEAQLLAKWGTEGTLLTTDVRFPKRPGFHCRWCAFNVKKGGPCDAVAETTPGGKTDDVGF